MLGTFSDTIRMKVREKSGGQIHYDAGDYLVFGFIDDTVLSILGRKVSTLSGTIILLNNRFLKVTKLVMVWRFKQ